MQVKDIMSKDVQLIDSTMSVQEAAKVMRDRDVGALPVGENDRLVGMITDRDIVIRGLTGNEELNIATVGQVMSQKCLYCFEDDTLEDLSKNLATNRIRRLPVLNTDKRLVGIVTLGDLSHSDAKDLVVETLSMITKEQAA